MPLTSGGITVLPAGAGRSYQIMFPPMSDVWNNGSGPSSNMTSRPGPSSVSSGVAFSTAATGVIQYFSYSPGVGGPGTFIVGDPQKGTPCCMLKNAAGGDFARIGFGQGVNYMETEQLTPGIMPDRFFKVWRFVMRAVFPLLSGPINQTVSDCGMLLIAPNQSSQNVGANRPGVQLGPTDAGVYTLRTRRGVGAAYDFTQNFTTAQLGLPNPSETFATYEIRVISADAGSPASMKFFVNESQIGPTFQVSAADGRVPGQSAGGGGFNGLCANVVNGNTGVYTWLFKYMCLIMTPDENYNL